LFEKKDIKPGMTVVLSNGQRRIVRADGLLEMDPACGSKYAARRTHLVEYCDGLRHRASGYDIVAVWDPEAGPLWQREERA
jgi:hypothetical protein